MSDIEEKAREIVADYIGYSTHDQLLVSAIASALLQERERAAKYPDWEGKLQHLRNDGWMVAAHNDYRLSGEFYTFWLLTHPSGRWLKGEGKSDAEAMDLIWIAAAIRTPEKADAVIE